VTLSEPADRPNWVSAFAVLAILVAALTLFGRQYVQMCLPLYRVMLPLIQSDSRVRKLEIDSGDNTTIHMTLERRMMLMDASGKLRPAMVVGHASTQLGYALAHPFIILGVVLIWPGLNLSRRAARLLISLPLLALVEMLDIPLALGGGIEDLLFAPMQRPHGIDWSGVMDGGGRYALSFAAAGIAAAIHAPWMNRRIELTVTP
jgi:hypothetical protein